MRQIEKERDVIGVEWLRSQRTSGCGSRQTRRSGDANRRFRKGPTSTPRAAAETGVTGQEASQAFLAAPAASRQRPLPGSCLGVGASAGAAWIAATTDNGPRRLPESRAAAGPVIAQPVSRLVRHSSGMAGTRLSYGRTIGSRDPRLQVAADRCGLLIVSPCDSIARSDELRLEM